VNILIWRAIASLSFAIWIYLALFRGRFWQLREKLPAATPSRSDFRVTAVIPARDEAGHIERAVAALRAQQFDGTLRIVVADDESTDGTAESALSAGADRAVRVQPRPAGWTGKLWAVASGIRAETSSPDFFLLADADIEFTAANALSALLARAEDGFDLVSVMVTLRSEYPAEKLLIPAFVFFFFMLYPPAWVSSRRPTAAAAGGCMLIRPQTLARIGGVDSIHAALIDDCALAARVKNAGGRVWLGTSAPPIRSIRDYPGAAHIRQMIARSAFAQLNHSTFLLLATIFGMLLVYIAPVALLFAGDPVTAALSALAWLLSAALFLPIAREYNVPRWTSLCLPAIALFYLAATIESAFRYWTGRGGIWKGRVQDSRH
jgi:hopene-associated glycosyltransferase HpnB